MELFLEHLTSWLGDKIPKEKVPIVLKKFTEEHTHNLNAMSLDDMNELIQNILIKQGKIKPVEHEAIDI